MTKLSTIIVGLSMAFSSAAFADSHVAPAAEDMCMNAAGKAACTKADTGCMMKVAKTPCAAAEEAAAAMPAAK